MVGYGVVFCINMNIKKNDTNNLQKKYLVVNV